MSFVTLQGNKVLDLTLGTAAPTMFTGAAKIRLTTTAPTNATAGTELTGTGYTTGGSTIVFNSAASLSATGPTSTISWTNGSGGTWSIVGLEIWDSAGTALRWHFGNWTGQPISVPNGAIFQITAAQITKSLT
jgi:hypothetical protein